MNWTYAYLELSKDIFNIKYSINKNMLFIYSDVSSFKICLDDYKRFFNYTIYHKSTASSGWHVQSRHKDLWFAIFRCASHDHYKEAHITSTPEDLIRFQEEAAQYYEF